MERTEYPRPRFRRDNWINLNGQWDFVFDDEDIGLAEKWQDGGTDFPCTINVPFVYESPLSGINTRERHDVVWYKREFICPSINDSELLMLHIGAADYHAQVFINGHMVAEHEGGETPFSANITPYLSGQPSGAPQIVAVRIEDRLDDETIPRGKQFWHSEPVGIWYTRSTGIWQTVWLEVLHKKHIDSADFSCDIDQGYVQIDVCSSSAQAGDQLRYAVTNQENDVVAQGVLTWPDSAQALRWQVDYAREHIFHLGVHGEGAYLWSPEHPNLFTVDFELIDRASGTRTDTVHTYFGVRKIEAKGGMIYLNNRPYYQKLVLDQGYWPQGLLTAPCDDDYRKDIELAKTMGFNGCRKHQKLEDPRFLYWADRLGFLVWEEGASAPMFSARSVQRVSQEWCEIIARDQSHPCIIVWEPLNESWGAPSINASSCQKHYSQALYHLVKSLDSSRPIISNDGWEQTESDICAIHNYAHGEAGDAEQYEEFKQSISEAHMLVNYSLNGHPIFASGFSYEGQPIILSECGGIAFISNTDTGNTAGWGYTTVSTQEEFLEEYQRLIAAIYSSKSLWGFCYTQLTDVEKEQNGLLTYTRQPKCPLKEIQRINSAHHPHAIG